jgi:exo beta-1,2-glucooligosaccharide sophorohydrolase (non-reducing end)
VFDNARAVHSYYYSRTYVIAPSALDEDHGHLPLAFDHVHSPPNSLRLQWASATGGDWRVRLAARQQFGINVFRGDALILWLYSPEGLTAADSPRLKLMDAEGHITLSGALLGTLAEIPAGQWTRIVLPLTGFQAIYRDTSDARFDLSHLDAILIGQGLDDARPHTLYLDDIRVGFAAEAESPAPAPVSALKANAFERHVELEWTASPSPEVESYRIYRAARPGDAFVEVGSQRGRYPRYEDFIGAEASARYQVRAVDTSGRESAASNEATARTHPMSDDELLTMVQRGDFSFYWDGAHPHAGMALEAMPGDENQVALGASGFGVMALLVGIERGFISREMGSARMQQILDFLRSADRYHGAWSHFLDGRTGRTMAVFGRYDNGGDLVETAFLMQGLLAARQYFDRDTAAERSIRATVTSLWEGVEWDWYRDPLDGGNFLMWHWSPDYGFYIHHPLIGWNETLIVYLLAIASPTHPVPASMWHSGWASQSDLAVSYRRGWSRTREGDHFTNGHSYYGIPLAVGEGNGAELFFTQFSFLGFDPRGIHDAYTNYFENNRAIARISHAYAIDNPRHCEGYGADTWGQSAGSHAGGARARPADDNCTVVVHAALASMPYTPSESMAALRHYYRDLGPLLWGAYGFSDSFNVTEDWYDETYRGLNQAQAVVMIENFRSGLLWRLFMRNAEIAPALRKIGFQPDR